LVGIIGAMQAAEALKLLCGDRTHSAEAACSCWMAVTMAWQELRLPRNPHCPVCGSGPAHRQAA